MSQLKTNVIILPEAQSDILRFYHFYLETANKLVAVDVVNTITAKLNILETDPLSGRFYQDSQYRLDYYELLIFFGKAKQNCYIALYHFDGKNAIRVLRIKNAREGGYRPLPDIDE
ncbi:MAG: type II toxin-antitoxin system RelE/ParE family toxin [Neisseria sp.]